MGIENRRQRRLEVRLGARVRGQGCWWDATILNFCQGGLYLELKGGHGEASNVSRNPESSEQLMVDFQLTSGGASTKFSLPGKVAHVGEAGFGFQFLKPDVNAWKGLIELHKRRKAASQEQIGASVAADRKLQASAIMRQVDQLVQQLMLRDTAQACERTADMLAAASRRSKDSNEEYEYARASNILNEQRGRIIETWVTNLSKRMLEASETLSSKQKDQQDVEEMKLVDQSSFDEWVAAVGLAGRLQAEFAEQLFALEQRFSHLFNTTVDKESNPLDPAVFILSFVDSLESYAFNPSIQRLFMGGMGNNLRPALKEIYESANQLLIDRGVMPKLELKAEKIPEGATRKKQEPPPPQSAPAPAGGASNAASTENGNSGKQGLFGSIKKVFTPARMSKEAKEEDAELLGKDVVLDALKSIDSDDQRSLKERVQDQLAGQHRDNRLQAEVEGALEASDSLIAAMRKDEKVGSGLGDLMSQLDAPLARAALENPEMLAGQDTPVTGFMQDLERLAVAMSGEGEAQTANLKQTIENALKHLGDNAEAGSAAFSEAREQLAPMVEKTEKQFDHNIERLREAKQGEDKMRQAHLQVSQAINGQLNTEAVPRLVVQLLKLGWENLLVVGILHQGKGSRHWQENLALIGRLAALLRTPDRIPAKEEALQLHAQIDKGFAEVPSNPQKQQKFLDALPKVLSHPELFKKVSQDTMPYQCELGGNQVQVEIPKDPAERDRLAPFVKTIRAIKNGEWLIERQESGVSRPLSMVWRDMEGDNFAFVDGKGARALETHVYELARRLNDGQLSILEDGGLPLVQRAVQDVLQKTYNQLLHNTETDSLTGLMNRRSFTKKLRAAREEAVSDRSTHVFLLVDLDQFKLINDICGHDGGDRLLCEVRDILKIYLADDVVLSRIGDDEFGVLIKYCKTEDGQEIAETQRKAIENHVLNWNGRKLSISASIGLVIINESSPSVDELFKDVDTAVYLAKKDGRNQVKLFESQATEVVEHKDEVQAARLVEDSIQKGLLQLYVQPIVPIFLDEGLSEHFEVLLRVLDDEGKAGSPEPLIKAAEGYGRMRIIDRWVVESLFNWIERNMGKIEELGGFSINLSGQSINSNDMLEFILEKLEKTPFPANRISFEITETAMIRDVQIARDFMLKIKERGCEFYLDDFGSGLASYSYLKDLPVDSVKIDGSFIRNINDDENDYAMVKSITETAHFMNKRVIAEYVTDEAIMIRLRELEVDYAQGWDVGKPFELTRLAS